VTFGSFNNLAKVTHEVLDLWARILAQVPDSHLRQKSIAFRTPDAVERFQRFFSDHGIARERIELVPYEASQLDHLQQYDLIDIALDTFPYPGVTTTCEALWMGVPVITLAGPHHASRVGVSLLSNAGFPDGVAETKEAYVQLATQLAADGSRLAERRATMRDRLRGSALMDAPRFARDLEAACRDVWRRWCAAPAAH
jgi:predicted O-linked N-acetylglucosamine transferase (SPINDLY family)